MAADPGGPPARPDLVPARGHRLHVRVARSEGRRRGHGHRAVRGRAAHLGQRRPCDGPLAAAHLSIARAPAHRAVHARRGITPPPGAARPRRVGRPRSARRRAHHARRDRPAPVPRPGLRPDRHRRLARAAPGAGRLVARPRPGGPVADRGRRRAPRANPQALRGAVPLAGRASARPRPADPDPDLRLAPGSRPERPGGARAGRPDMGDGVLRPGRVRRVQQCERDGDGRRRHQGLRAGAHEDPGHAGDPRRRRRVRGHRHPGLDRTRRAPQDLPTSLVRRLRRVVRPGRPAGPAADPRHDDGRPGPGRDARPAGPGDRGVQEASREREPTSPKGSWPGSDRERVRPTGPGARPVSEAGTILPGSIQIVVRSGPALRWAPARRPIAATLSKEPRR